MAQDEFAEALRRVVAEAQDSGIDRPAMIEALDERAVGLRVSKAEQVRQMMKLPDAIPVTQEQALVWAESLLGDQTYEDAIAVAQALLATNTASHLRRWPISARNARVLHDALVRVARQRRH